VNSTAYIQQRILKLTKYLNKLDIISFRELTDLDNLDKPGLYFIYNLNSELMYVGTTDRPLSERIAELRDQPKDHTFHSKHVREALEIRLNRRIKKYNAKKLSRFQGHELISIEDFKQILNEVKISIQENYRYRAIEFENTVGDLMEAKATEHFAIAILQPQWNDDVERIVSDLLPIELFI
jgi:hypothetical protein